jgi:hypothetical protein
MAWKESDTSTRLAFSETELTVLDLFSDGLGGDFPAVCAGSQYGEMKREADVASLGLLCWGFGGGEELPPP